MRLRNWWHKPKTASAADQQEVRRLPTGNKEPGKAPHTPHAARVTKQRWVIRNSKHEPIREEAVQIGRDPEHADKSNANPIGQGAMQAQLVGPRRSGSSAPST